METLFSIKEKTIKVGKVRQFVLGKDGQYILLRHGGGHFKVHPSHLMRKDKSRVTETDLGKNNTSSDCTEQSQKSLKTRPINTQCNEVNKNTWAIPAVHLKKKSTEDVNKGNNSFLQDQSTTIIEEQNTHHDQIIETSTPHSMDYRDSVELDDNSSSSDEMNEVFERMSQLSFEETVHQDSRDNSIKPNINTHIEFQIAKERYKAKVLSKQLKRSGRNKDWVNVIKEGETQPLSIDWSQVEKWYEVDSSDETVYLCAIEQASQDVVDAKCKEVENLVLHDVFDEIDDTGQSIISTKWVITEKCKNGKKVTKARLVARGFEEDSRTLRTDSPTCSKQNFRIVLSIAASKSWTIHSLDISSAFLQGDVMKRDIFVKPPVDAAPQGKIWKLKRCLYGLNDAPRAWYTRVRNELTKLGAVVSVYDQALFMWYHNRKLIGLLACHVDDFNFLWNRKISYESNM